MTGRKWPLTYSATAEVACPEFCGRLKTISPGGGVLLSHDELIAALDFSDDDKERGRSLGTWRDLQLRTKCPFCRLVVAAVTENADADAYDAIPPDQDISVLLFPGEQAFRLSYPRRLGTRLGFVAEDAHAAAGADTARLVSSSGIQLSMVKAWIETCDQKHATCTKDTARQVAGEREDGLGSSLLQNFREQDTSNFRVIDLKRGCVRPARLHCRYVALSYVWGNLPMFRLQADNFERLSEQGSFESIRSGLPKTVNDAIDLTRALDERYLWIDGLCLVQDDDADVSLGVKMMNSIYRGSCFTIVAGSGIDASAGLPGVGRTERGVTHRRVMEEIAPGLRMAILHGIDWHLSRSVYKTRGWTLQELVLPRRTLIFINGQVFFRCEEANWSEDSWADNWTHGLDPDDSNLIRLPDPVEGFMPCSWAYQKMCEDYSRRTLRRDGDTLRAFSGICRPLAAGMSTLLVEGLPGYFLNHFLLFISSKGDLRRRQDFAGYSWAGWQGPVMWPRENFVWFKPGQERTWRRENILKYMKYNQLVKWAALYPNGRTESLTSLSWNAPSPLHKLMQEHPDVFPEIAEDLERDTIESTWSSGSGSHGDMPHWERFDYDGADEGSRAEHRLARPLPGFCLKTFDLANSQVEIDRLLRRIDDQRERLALFNWAAVRGGRVRDSSESKSVFGPAPVFSEGEESHCRFRRPRDIEKELVLADERVQRHIQLAKYAAGEKNEPSIDYPNLPKFPPYPVLQFHTISLNLVLGSNTHQEQRGESVYDRIPGIPLISASGELVGSLHPDNLAELQDVGSHVELLVIARSNTPTVGSAMLSSNHIELERQWNLFWAIQVVWKDRIAERRGVAQILHSSLESAVEPRPEVKRVLLG